ncbi:hypothetical protein [Burkholderia diffusa]|uniref:hypothetical protein n=1 Tax=Burkholderia diffusa TaxID=488732 RepID=UPI000A4D99CE|nr:hypothetical protein [Burkholderia diffusa]
MQHELGFRVAHLNEIERAPPVRARAARPEASRSAIATGLAAFLVDFPFRLM